MAFFLHDTYAPSEPLSRASRGGTQKVRFVGGRGRFCGYRNVFVGIAVQYPRRVAPGGCYVMAAAGRIPNMRGEGLQVIIYRLRPGGLRRDGKGYAYIFVVSP